MVTPGRPRKNAAEYANARDVENAMLPLHEAGKEWVSSEEVIAALESVGKPRMAWYRGKDRLLSSDPPRLELRARLENNRAVEFYRMRSVETESATIPTYRFLRLTPEQRRLLRPRNERDRQGRSLGFIDGLANVALEMASTDKLEKEILRREHLDPVAEAQSAVADYLRATDPNFDRDLRRRLRPMDIEVLERILRERAGTGLTRPTSTGDRPIARRGEPSKSSSPPSRKRTSNRRR